MTAIAGLRPAFDAGPLPSSAADGPAFPTTWPASELHGSGVSMSLRPILAPEGFGSGEPLRYEVYDSSAGQQIGTDTPFEASTEQGPWQTPALLDGHQYLWRVAPSGTTDWQGPWTFDIDTVRPGLAPRDDFAGVSTHLITGVPAVTWSSRSFSTVTSSANANLEFQPGRTGDAGLPSGWRMTAPLVSRWTTLQASGEKKPATVYISDARDRSMTFRLNDSGVYVQAWGNGAPLPPSDQPTLTYNGGFELTERDGTVTEFAGSHPTSMSTNGIQRGTATWNADGLLESVADPSGRSISFTYGGGSCPTWKGFVAAPSKMLCRISWWDGSRTDIGYVSSGETSQIGLIVDAVTDDFAGTSLGIGWDASGRVSSVRSAMVGAAAAADSSLRERKDVLTQVVYDDAGRVAAVAAPAPEPGGQRQAHVYSYPTISAGDSASTADVVSSVSSGSLTGDLGAASDVTLSQSAIAGSADYRMTVRARDWTPLQRQDRDGSNISLAWNPKTQRLESVEDYEGRTMSFTYDAAGRRTGMQGPATSSDAAYSTKNSYDENPDGTRMRGLKAIYFGSKDFSGDNVTLGWVASRASSGLSHKWEEAPIAGQAWSTRLVGTWEVPEGGTWRFEPSASSGNSITMYIDNTICDVQSGSTCELPVKKGSRQIRIDISVPEGGAASFEVRGALKGDRLDTINDIFPSFNTETSTVSNDDWHGVEKPTVTTQYNEPWTGNPTSLDEPGGRHTTATYETSDSGADRWGRKLTGTTPGGMKTLTSYWPVKGAAETSPCAGAAAAPQAGQVRTVTRTDGVPVTTWYDSAGRPAAVLTGDQSTGDLACSTYTPDGTPIKTTYLAAGTVVETSSLEIAPDGDPRVSITRVKNSGSLVDGEHIARTTVDLLGRVVSYVDITGVKTAYAFDVYDREVSRTITAPNGSVLVTSETVYDEVTGRVASMLLDGKQTAAVEYDNAGLIDNISYGNGTDQVWAYSANGSIEGTRIRATDQHVVHDSVESNDAGRVMGRTTSLEGSGATTHTWMYAYDESRRLTDAVLKVAGSTAGVGADTASYSYGFGVQESCGSAYADPGSDLNRTSGSRNGQSYVTCYDKAGRPISTSDPLVTQGGTANLAWDALGRLTGITGTSKVLSVEWMWGGLPSRIVDGPVTSELDHAQGRLVGQRSTDGASTVDWTMGYSSPSATAPSVLIGSTGTEVRVMLPGGALWRKTSQGTTIDHPGIRGEFVVRTGSTGAVVPGDDGALLAQVLGPFGEPLGGGGKPGSPEYGYAFAQLQPTMPGPSGIILKTARPYLPALGAFLAFDTQPGSSTTGYGYAEADPLNKSDPDGAYSWWDFGRDVLAVSSIAVSIALPGAQWYAVVAISVLTSSASLGITALERSANGETLTSSDLVFEGLSVVADVMLLGIGEAAGAVSRKLTKPAKAVGSALDDVNVRPALKPANIEETAKAPSWKTAISKAALMVVGMRAISGGFSSGEPPMDQVGPAVDPNECPFEGGCANVPDRRSQANSAM